MATVIKKTPETKASSKPNLLAGNVKVNYIDDGKGNTMQNLMDVKRKLVAEKKNIELKLKIERAELIHLLEVNQMKQDEIAVTEQNPLILVGEGGRLQRLPNGFKKPCGCHKKGAIDNSSVDGEVQELIRMMDDMTDRQKMIRAKYEELIHDSFINGLLAGACFVLIGVLILVKLRSKNESEY